MTTSLVKLILLATLASFGMSDAGFFSCHSRECQRMVEKRFCDILKIDWKPISVFPEEAKRFLPKRPGKR